MKPHKNHTINQQLAPYGLRLCNWCGDPVPFDGFYGQHPHQCKRCMIVLARVRKYLQKAGSKDAYFRRVHAAIKGSRP